MSTNNLNNSIINFKNTIKAINNNSNNSTFKVSNHVNVYSIEYTMHNRIDTIVSKTNRIYS